MSSNMKNGLMVLGFMVCVALIMVALIKWA